MLFNGIIKTNIWLNALKYNRAISRSMIITYWNIKKFTINDLRGFLWIFDVFQFSFPTIVCRQIDIQGQIFIQKRYFLWNRIYSKFLTLNIKTTFARLAKSRLTVCKKIPAKFRQFFWRLELFMNNCPSFS